MVFSHPSFLRYVSESSEFKTAYKGRIIATKLKKISWNISGIIGMATIFVHSFNLSLKLPDSHAKVPHKLSQLSLS
jgi:hypothetical protein